MYWKVVIGASMSEPHTGELNGGFSLYMCIYVLYVVRRFVYFDAPIAVGHMQTSSKIFVHYMTSLAARLKTMQAEVSLKDVTYEKQLEHVYLADTCKDMY